jgi:hypothetical protein
MVTKVRIKCSKKVLALTRSKNPAATLGGWIGFGISVFILAKLPEVQALGVIAYLSNPVNALVSLAVISFGILFGIVIGSLFEKPVPDTDYHDEASQ